MQINETPWGTEEVVASNDLYCAVRLHIKAGNALPMVFHQRHDKTWYILRGQALVRRINLSMGKIAGQRLVAGENVRIWPLHAAQLIAETDCEILQVGNACDVRDRFILPEAGAEVTSVSPFDPSPDQAPA